MVDNSEMLYSYQDKIMKMMQSELIENCFFILFRKHKCHLILNVM